VLKWAIRALRRSMGKPRDGSQRCFWQSWKALSRLLASWSWKAFSRLLASGQLEGILALPVCQEMLDRDAPATRRRPYTGDW
jgi:hypothetical protein